MPLLTSILVLLVSARLLGELMIRFKQPALVGEILAGIILGPGLLNLVKPTDHLAGISELSVFLIVLSAGLEMDLGEVVTSIRGRAFFGALIGFLLPLFSGLALGTAFGFDLLRSTFLALCISITALPVAVRILGNFKLLNTQIARFSIATAIINDVAALLIVGVVLDLKGAEGWGPLILAVVTPAAKLLVFALMVFVASRLLLWGGSQTHYLERLMEKAQQFFGREAIFGIAILFVLVFASMSENFGSHFVIGAFFGALILNKDVFGTSLFCEVENTLNSISAGFLAPIFFAFLGLSFSVKSFSSPFFVLMVLAVSISSKICGGFVGARWAGMPRTDALGVGIILNGRGIMELVVANIAYQRGFIDQALFSTLVLMGLLTTVITPILFRRCIVGSRLPAN